MSFLSKIPECHVFHPTWEEFKNFQKLVTRYEKEATSGVFKIVPPKGYKARKDGYKNIDFIIPNPIEQIVNGQNGVYELILLQTEPKTLSRYQKLVEGGGKIIENKKQLEIEETFWNSLKYQAPIYGADTPGSIFDENTLWNLSKLDTVLNKGLDSHITGVTTPYLYVGAWKTLFAWHKEDMDLNSINYLHFGKNKIWYSVHPKDSEKFESLAKKLFPNEFKKCPEFLRHKTYLINPSILIENGITVHRCVQKQGEFVVTQSLAYHCGFNSGFNCAEAVNFALESWIDDHHFTNAKACTCRSDTVKIDKAMFSQNLKNNMHKPSMKQRIKIDKENHLSPRSKKHNRSSISPASSPKLKSSNKVNKFLKQSSPKKKKKIGKHFMSRTLKQIK